MKHILITGGEGQLAQCFKNLAKGQDDLQFLFVSKKEIDITNKRSINKYLEKHHVDYCINTAAYTQVDQAEKELDKAFLVNAQGVKNMATACKEHNITLLHLSTDYVFDGAKGSPYDEEDLANPINVYGTSKWQGEVLLREILEHHFIIRTSWLYSQYGQNFYTTMLQWIQQNKNVAITTAQTGSPTNANDLASFLTHIILTNSSAYGTYHFSNQGETTWYGFAKAIESRVADVGKFSLASTDHYPTFAERPAYSVLNTKKAEQTFDVEIPTWQESLDTLMTNNNNH